MLPSAIFGSMAGKAIPLMNLDLRSSYHGTGLLERMKCDLSR
jgi:hypothetical protein